jgi:lysophospholipase L1-like esterase
MPVSTLLTNTGVAISNGLFTTTLDFGPVFDGTAFWLDIGVRTNGGTNGFVSLSSRQSLVQVPSAIFASTARTLSGVLAVTNLPADVALTDGNPIFSGTVTAASIVTTNPTISGLPTYAPDISSLSEIFPSNSYLNSLTWKRSDTAETGVFTVLRAAYTNTVGTWIVPPTGWPTSMPIWYSFGLDSSWFIFSISGDGEFCGISVDGADDDSRFLVAPDGGQHYYRVNFATSARRRITLKLSDGGGFYGCWIDPTSGWLGSIPYKMHRLIVLGDSFTEDPDCRSFPSRLMQLFKNLDVWASGVGSTGYISPGTAGRTNFQGRVMADVIANRPEYVLVAGGINDTSNSSNDVYTAATQLYLTIRTNLPATKIFVVGPWWPRSPVDPNALRTMYALSNACVTAGITQFIDNLSDPWITGYYSLPGSGNAVNYTSSDGTHPTPAGHWYLAYRLAGEIGPSLPELIPADGTR